MLEAPLLETATKHCGAGRVRRAGSRWNARAPKHAGGRRSEDMRHRPSSIGGQLKAGKKIPWREARIIDKDVEGG